MPLISICIPTCKRPEILKETLNSIFSQNVDRDLFDVCVTDNSDTDETKSMIEKELQKYTNLHYKKVVCEGFMNSIEALKFGDGELLKLHNDYSKFQPNAINKMLDTVKSIDKKSVIFFGMNNGELPDGFTEYTKFDDFLFSIHYWSTWSSAFSVWKNDFDVIMNKNISLDKMFPHTSILFELFDKEKYYIDNFMYTENLQLKKKGGYNLVDNFVCLYMGMVRKIFNEGKISEKTYERINTYILHFVAFWLVNVKVYKDVYSFSFENWEEKVENQYGIYGIKYVKKYYRNHILKEWIKKYIKGNL